jgi:hypothetical protein
MDLPGGDWICTDAWVWSVGMWAADLTVWCVIARMAWFFLIEDTELEAAHDARRIHGRRR